MVLVDGVMHVKGINFYIFYFLTISRYLGETALVDKKVFCPSCLSKKFPQNKTAKFEESDAKFKCPVQKCNADQLSFAEFHIGSCCENASRWTQKTCKI